MLRVAAAVAAMSLVLGGPAFAGSVEDRLYSNFMDMCIAGDGDSATALAKAGAAGWQAVPEGAVDDERIENVQARFSMEGGAFSLLLTGDSPDSFSDDPNARVQVCAVAEQNADAAQLEARVRAWVGGGPHEELNEPTFRGYPYTLDGAKRAPVDPTLSSDDAAVISAAGRLRVAAVAGSDGVTMLMLMRPQ